MPSYTAKEIATICSIEPKNVHVYASRGKLVKKRDGLFDAENPINAIFIDKFKTGTKLSREVSQIIGETNSEKLDQLNYSDSSKKAKRNSKKNIDDNDSADGFTSASKLNDLRAKKLTEEIIQLSLKNQRLEGELIEVAIIEKLTLEVIKAYRSTLFLAAENVIKNNMIDLGADNDKLTKAVSDLQALFNSACASAIDQTKQSIDQML